MIEVSEPAERTVSIELTESDAYVLKMILGHTYLSSGVQAAGAFVPQLFNELSEAKLKNGKYAGVSMTNRGIRIYDESQEW